MEIYYKLPQRWLDKLPGINNLTLYTRGHDLFSIDKMNGVVDPEMKSAGHPLMNQYTLGINVCF